ncbi:hypothetical protein HYH03_009139 [Edaphochlamys debaryana]|uniref:heme oxygenase (biliverdin-producing) n=1 Tax=Edaphochlamys debaryana TaxID=47281 RepID=A0A836BYP9_9CHLO|nr:hypothetical protein HYH03_009139 [Edaphochlamys debaryana]|eukprot:KAG2492474.1 hypothetical protein HYH03_009139 [Edaphochlamys debaryana]
MMLSTRVPVHQPSRSARRAAAPAPRRALQVVCHGHGHGHGGSASAVLTEKDKGFIAEMRKVAMKLHTREQAPKEGGKEAPKQQGPWTPTRPGYLRFLTESKVVFDTFERIIATNDEYKAFRNTGLERSQALSDDLNYFRLVYHMSTPQLKQDGPGMKYAQTLEKLAREDPPAFICHYYNFYFAHTAGGRMIGNKVAGMLLGGHTLAFYKWRGDVAEHLEAVRRSLNQMAEGWSDQQRQHCLAETEATFGQAGQILRCITAAN